MIPARARALLLAFVCAGAAIGAATSPDLTIREVTVLGARRLDPAEVRAAAGLDGEQALRASASAAAAQVRALPAVREARVGIELPHRAVIEIVERTPAITVTSAGARLFADEVGFLFAAGGDASGLAVLDDETARARSGRRLDGGTVQAVHAIDALQAGYFGMRVVRIRLTERYGLVVNLEHALAPPAFAPPLTEVRLGTTELVEQKLEIARRIVLSREGRRLDYVDVRTPDAATFFPRD